jgi:hypothetical protein
VFNSQVEGPRDAWRQEMFQVLFADLAADWESKLNLRNWTVHWLVSDPVDDDVDTEGQCKVRMDLGYQAWITIADRLADEPAWRRERVVVHELLHVKFDELFQFLAHYLDEEHQTYFRRLVEVLVEDLAVSFVRLRAGEGEDEDVF